MATQTTRRAEPQATAYKYAGTPINVAEELFRVQALPLGKGGPVTPLDDVCTGIDWQDMNAEMSGSMQITDEQGTLKLYQNQVIDLAWMSQPGQSWRELWRMKVQTPEQQAQAKALTVQLQTALTQANKGTDNYSYRKDRKHPHGWTCDQIARDVGDRTHIPLGTLARGTHRITNLVLKGAKPMDVINRAYTAERRATGRLFFTYWNGWLNVAPLTPSGELLELAGVLIDASLQEKLRADFATALTVRASTKGKGSKHKTSKVVVTVKSTEGIRKFGYVHREVTAPDAHTPHEVRRYGEGLLAKVVKAERTLKVTIPIRPELKRGQAFTIDWASQGLTQVCYVGGLEHHVAPGASTTTITAMFTSPFADARAKADKESRDAKAKAHGRTVNTNPAVTGGTSPQAKRRSG